MIKELALPELNSKNSLILLSIFLSFYMLFTWIKSKIYFQPSRETCLLHQIHLNPYATQMGFDGKALRDLLIPKGSGHIHGWILNSETVNPLQVNPLQTGGGEETQLEKPDLSQRNLIIISHGNGGSVLDRHSLMRELEKQLQTDVVVYDYSGYGSTSTSYWMLTEKILQEDCRLVVEHFIKKGYQKKNIVLYGESIGVPITCHTANKMSIDKIILQSGPASITDVSNDLIPRSLSWLVKMIVWGDFSTKSYLRNLKKKMKDSKVILLHSEDDEIVSYRNAKILEKHGGTLIDIKGYHNYPIISTNVWERVKDILF